MDDIQIDAQRIRKLIDEDEDFFTHYGIDGKGRLLTATKNKFAVIADDGKNVMDITVPFNVDEMHVMLDGRHVLLVEDTDDEDNKHPVHVCIDTETKTMQKIIAAERSMRNEAYISHSGFFLQGTRLPGYPYCSIFEYRCGTRKFVKMHQLDMPGFNTSSIEYDAYANRFIYSPKFPGGNLVKAYNVATETTETLLDMAILMNPPNPLMSSFCYIGSIAKDHLIMHTHNGKLLYNTISKQVICNLGDVSVEMVSPDGTILFLENNNKFEIFNIKTLERRDMDMGNETFIEDCEISGNGKYIIAREEKENPNDEDRAWSIRPFVVPLNHPIFSVSHETHWASLMSNGELMMNRALGRGGIRESMQGFPDADIKKMEYYSDLKKVDPAAQSEEELLLNFHYRMFRMMAAETGLI